MKANVVGDFYYFLSNFFTAVFAFKPLSCISPVNLSWFSLPTKKKKKKESDFPEPESQVGVFAIATASSHEVSSILSVKATSGSLLSSEPTTLPFCAVMRGSNLCAAAGAKKGRLLLAIAPPVELCIEVVVTFRVFFCG